jgi:hypothetical protein
MGLSPDDCRVQERRSGYLSIDASGRVAKDIIWSRQEIKHGLFKIDDDNSQWQIIEMHWSR